jgi:iron(III) transport system substrate-binding protein
MTANAIRRSRSSCIARALLCAGIALAAAPLHAQTRSLAELAAYRGADRTARLIEGAKREGTVTYYTSLVAEDTTPVIDAFKKAYGIDVQVWRAALRRSYNARSLKAAPGAVRRTPIFQVRPPLSRCTGRGCCKQSPRQPRPR